MSLHIPSPTADTIEQTVNAPYHLEMSLPISSPTANSKESRNAGSIATSPLGAPPTANSEWSRNCSAHDPANHWYGYEPPGGLHDWRHHRANLTSKRTAGTRRCLPSNNVQTIEIAHMESDR